MNIIKKIALLLVLTSLISLVSCSWEDVTVTPGGDPVPNPDQPNTQTDEVLTSNGTYGLTFDEGLDYFVVTGYHGTESDVFIPSEWEGKKVIGINSYAFNENEIVKSITITSSITSISKNAIIGDYLIFCEAEEKGDGWHSEWYVSREEGKVEWGCGSFGSFTWSCDKENNIIITGYIENPVVLNIPEKIGSRTVVGIDSDAFRECTSLKKINLPDTITSIGSFAFRYCSALEEVKLPKNTTSLSGYLFQGCESLSTVIFSEKTVSIGRYAFADCSALTRVSLPNGVQVIETQAFSNCKELKEANIPSSVQKIEAKVFSNCNNADFKIFLDFEENKLPSTWETNWNSSKAELIYRDTPETNA